MTLSHSLQTAATDAQRQLQAEPREHMIATIAMELVRRVRAHAETAAALEDRAERAERRLQAMVPVHQGQTREIRRILEQWWIIESDQGNETRPEVSPSVKEHARLWARDELIALVSEDGGEPHQEPLPVDLPTDIRPLRELGKFRRPREDFVRVIIGGAIRG